MTGAVSGGCVEKEILKQSHTVFKSGKAKMMTYDGRYRLGCEGTLYILIEVFAPEKDLLDCFAKNLEERNPFRNSQTIIQGILMIPATGVSQFLFNGDKSFLFNGGLALISDSSASALVFKQKLDSCFKLMIIGAEHDAAQLSIMAASLVGRLV